VRSTRFWLLCVGLVTILALVACAGDDSSAKSDSNAAPANNAVPVSDSGENAPAVSGQQATPTGEPLAALVNGEPITLAAFQRERDRRLTGLAAQPATDAAFEADILNAMIDQVLIEQAAEVQGIVVTDAEVDSELAIQESLAEQTGQSLEEIVAAQLYTMDEYRELIRGMLLSQKLSQVVVKISPNAPQVHSRHILVADEATARQLIAQIQGGADFAQLAMQYSLDGSTAPTGGDLDWVGEGDLLQPEVEAAIFSNPPGTLIPEPVQSSLGYHVIEVLERVEDRPLTQATLAEKKQQAFLEWLQTQRDTAEIVRYVGNVSQ
jgi:peptidyl-prolyl cis-trans isomerase C